MYDLPVTIEIDGEEIPIRNNGDYRMVLDCFLALQDPECESDDERIFLCLIIFYADLDSDSVFELSEEELQERTKKMYEFFDCGQDLSLQPHSPYKLMDWEQDSQLILSAVNVVAGKEIRAEKYMHWWTFMGYYMNIGEGAFATIVGIRSKIMKGKKLEKHEKEFKRDNPQYFVWNNKTLNSIEADNAVRELWNKNSQKGGD